MKSMARYGPSSTTKSPSSRRFSTICSYSSSSTRSYTSSCSSSSSWSRAEMPFFAASCAAASPPCFDSFSLLRLPTPRSSSGADMAFKQRKATNKPCKDAFGFEFWRLNSRVVSSTFVVYVCNTQSSWWPSTGLSLARALIQNWAQKREGRNCFPRHAERDPEHCVGFAVNP